MSKPFDAGSKTMLELGPAAWLGLFGTPRPAERLTIIPAELSSITAMADHVVRVEDPAPWLLHVEFQSHWDGTLPGRMLACNGAILVKHDLPVASVAVLLSPAANASNLTGLGAAKRYPQEALPHTDLEIAANEIDPEWHILPPA